MIMVFVACYGLSCPCSDGNGQTFYVAIPCNGGGDSEGGGSSGGGSGGNGPPTGGGFDTEPNPGNSGIQTPCQSLKNKLNEPFKNGENFKSKLQDLKNYVTNSVNEKGYANQNPNENPNTNTNLSNQYNPLLQKTNLNGEKSVLISILGPQMFGYMHTHPDQPNVRGIHSIADIKVFLNMVKERDSYGLSIDNTYGIVVGNHGVYALKIDNMNTIINGYVSIPDRAEFNRFWDEFEKKYKEMIETVNTYPNTKTGNEKALLNLLKTIEDMTGIGIYRANNELTNWDKLTLSSNGTIIPISCN